MTGRQVGFRLSPNNEARYRRDKKLYGHKTFDEWLTALLVRENLFRQHTRALMATRDRRGVVDALEQRPQKNERP